MTSIEERLADAARQLRAQVDGSVDVDHALSQVTSPGLHVMTSRTSPSRSRRPAFAFAVAAAALLLAALGGFVVTRDDVDRLVTGGSPTTEPGAPSTAAPSSTTVTEAPPTVVSLPFPEATSIPTPQTTATVSDPQAFDRPDLQAPAAGHEITFTSVGGVVIGQPLDPAEVDFGEGVGIEGCGWWYLGGRWDFGSGAPEPGVGGRVIYQDRSAPHLEDIRVTDPSYRTASGVGVGTSLATLEHVYGADLVVDRTDAESSPAPGELWARYQDVAAVRHGEFALTFTIHPGDIVRDVKVSAASMWGDDEGCS